MKKTVAERLKSFRIHVGLNVADFAELLEKGTPAIYAIEQGRVFPQIDDLAKLQRLYGLNLNWIVSGNGNMILNENKKDFDKGSIKEMINNLKNNPEDEELLFKINSEVDKIIRNNEKLMRVFTLLEEVKKGN